MVLVEDTRGASEILFISLLTLTVVTTGALASTFVFNSSENSAEEISPPEFELTSTDPIRISYIGDQQVRSSITDEIYFSYDNTTNQSIRYDIYPENHQPLSPGDVVYNSRNDDHTIEYGSRIDIVWVREGGGGGIVQEIYIPPSEVTGTAVRSNGSVSVIGGGPNMSTN
jgi:hypothetical protein